MRSNIDETTWRALLDRLGLSDLNAITYAKLVAAYSKPDRHYHSLDHIADCLDQLDACALPAEQSDPIALALWFHDAVYNWRSKTNEADSATWAGEFLNGCDAAQELSTHVIGFIMATRHFVPEPLVGDQFLIVDIDLSILGRAPDVYDRYEVAIGEEYKWVPKVTYRRERRAVLRSFLERDTIFQTDRFKERFDVPARENLQRAIDQL